MEALHEVEAIKESYEQLKAHIIEHVTRRHVSVDVVKRLKNNFQEEINSVRRLSCIDSLHDLIRVLEKRCVLTPCKVDRLESIIRLVGADKSRYLKHCELISASRTRATENLNIEENDNQGRPIEGQRYSQAERCDNMNGIISTPQPSPPPSVVEHQRQYCNHCNHHQYSDNDMPNNNYRNRLRPDVIDLICHHIGNKWKDLGRNLGVIEGIIDEIDTNCQRNSEKCRKVLSEYERTVMHWEMNDKLLKGLTKARRKDLAEKPTQPDPGLQDQILDTLLVT